MNPDFLTNSNANSNANEIRSIETLNDLITVLNQVRVKVGGNVKVMVAGDAQGARYEHECSSISDVLMVGMQSMMNEYDTEDTRIVLI